MGDITSSVDPWQECSVGGTTDVSPDSATDPRLTGTVGGTTGLLSLLEYSEGTLDHNVGSTTSVTSPATSTPGSTPRRNKDGEVMKPELNKSNEELSPIVEKKVVKLKLSKRQRPQTEDSEDSHESIDESQEPLSPQSVSDSLWDTTVDMTNDPTKSCVALRTRSHTEGIRKQNLSIIMGGGNGHHSRTEL